ncbi:MAG: hypothetical protein P8046_14755 [Anaerolineales bacterium]
MLFHRDLVENIMRLKNSIRLASLLVVVALLLGSATTASAQPYDTYGAGSAGQAHRGVFVNILRPDQFSPPENISELNAAIDQINRASLLQRELNSFASKVSTGNASTLAGVFVDDEFELPVIQQPGNAPGFVSNQDGVVTQFRMASQYGSIGILAHNTLSGAFFFDLQPGEQIYLVYGDGSTERYQVIGVRHFQALQPNSDYSEFLDLDNNGAYYSVSDLFNEVYAQPGQLVLQTCIAVNGVSSWGRLFILAQKVT